MAAIPTTLAPVNERTTQVYTATLLDETGAAIALADLSALTLTFYNIADRSIINSRDGQDVLNANNVTVHATSGLLTWTMQAADNAIIGNAQSLEGHLALFEWTLTNGNVGNHEVIITVRNLGMVP